MNKNIAYRVMSIILSGSWKELLVPHTVELFVIENEMEIVLHVIVLYVVCDEYCLWWGCGGFIECGVWSVEWSVGCGVWSVNVVITNSTSCSLLKCLYIAQTVELLSWKEKVGSSRPPNSFIISLLFIWVWVPSSTFYCDLTQIFCDLTLIFCDLTQIFFIFAPAHPSAHPSAHLLYPFWPCIFHFAVLTFRKLPKKGENYQILKCFDLL